MEIDEVKLDEMCTGCNGNGVDWRSVDGRASEFDAWFEPDCTACSGGGTITTMAGDEVVRFLWRYYGLRPMNVVGRPYATGAARAKRYPNIALKALPPEATE